MNEQDKPIDAEVVKESHALMTRPPSGLPSIGDMEQQFAIAVRQRELLSDYIKKQLKPNKHYYQRGDQKPSLTKEGAEIILLPHGLVPDYQLVSGPEGPLDTDQPYQITVKCVLRRSGDPTSFCGSGIGSASSHKGTWRGKDWVYQMRQTDRGLCHNATAKMAQKSALIAATINSTAASEFFTQDMDPENTPAPPAPPAAVPPKKPKSFSVEECRKSMVDKLTKMNLQDDCYSYLVSVGWMLDTETLATLEPRYVPRNPDQWDLLMRGLGQFIKDGVAEIPYDPIEEPPPEKPKKSNAPTGPSEDEPWRSFPMPFGKFAGVPLSEMDKGQLWYWWNTYEVEETFQPKDGGPPKKLKPTTVAKNRKFREMLDQAGQHYQFKKKEEEDAD